MSLVSCPHALSRLNSLSRPHALTLSLALALAAAPAFAASTATGYEDWQWRPVHVDDTNADENVRFEADLTVPMHGPWLTLPDATAMTVSWITRAPCAAGIEYWESGTTNRLERWSVRAGILDCSRDMHSFRLTGLKPGTAYEYRLLSFLDENGSPWGYVGRARETHAFRTIDPKRDNYRVFLTSDIHGGARLSLTPMYERTGAKDADFFIFLGDNVSDGPYNNYRFYATMGFLDDVTRLWGPTKPSIFMRGNHDIWGPEAHRHGEIFPQPDEKTYYAVRQGPCLFVTLDTMWPQPKKKFKNGFIEAYQNEQVAWLRALKATDAWKTATFRVVLFHVPVIPNTHDFPTRIFGAELADETPAGRVHAVLSGHEHCYARVNPNTKETRVNNAYGDFPPTGRRAYPPHYFRNGKIPDRFPYVSVVCHSSEGMTIDVSPAKLVFKSHRWEFTEGGYFDAFELTPDGKVTDLVKTTAYSLVPPPKKK